MADDVSRAYARSLLRLRTARGLSYRQLGIASGVSHGFICDMEAGRKGCTLRIAHALATALDVTVDAMISESLPAPRQRKRRAGHG